MAFRKLGAMEYEQVTRIFYRWREPRQTLFCEELRDNAGTVTMDVGPRGGILWVGERARLSRRMFSSVQTRLFQWGYTLVIDRQTCKVHIRREY